MGDGRWDRAGGSRRRERGTGAGLGDLESYSRVAPAFCSLLCFFCFVIFFDREGVRLITTNRVRRKRRSRDLLVSCDEPVPVVPFAPIIQIKQAFRHPPQPIDPHPQPSL